MQKQRSKQTAFLAYALVSGPCDCFARGLCMLLARVSPGGCKWFWIHLQLPARHVCISLPCDAPCRHEGSVLCGAGQLVASAPPALLDHTCLCCLLVVQGGAAEWKGKDMRTAHKVGHT